ncbi:DUF535 family protein [Massilia sp. erpn]|uniref:DUF535 family protein n=1 Tax=Massilia sp. erpn TaxID=2738142 RepID=UPI0021066842|nr:DUF535 family protein [Massilia sp. erpn]UTY59378.1 DUF535 family protein [Massilia sp. erpn]
MAAQLMLLRDTLHHLGNFLSVGFIVFHFHKHIKLMRVMYHPRTRHLIRRHPKIVYKYLVKYAALNLATRCRLALVTSHYSLMQKFFNDAFADMVYGDKLVLWKSEQANSRLTIDLDFPATFHTEGDLCISMKLAERAVYRLVFILSSGATFGLEQQNVVFITCVQGLVSQTALRPVIAECDDTHPADVLMAAVQGVAVSLGISTLVGIRTEQQVCSSEKTYFSYDNFFEEYGMLDRGMNAYLISIPMPRKDLALIPSKHRARARRKRVFRDAICDSVQHTLAPYLIEISQKMA